MRKSCFYILFLFFLFPYSYGQIEQDIVENKLKIELNSQIKSLVMVTLDDSLFVDYDYVYENFESYMNSLRKRLLQNKIKDTNFYFNPFSEEDYSFIINQGKDTLGIFQPKDFINYKLITNLKSNEERPCLVISKPLFSNNFEQAYIEVRTVYYGGGGRGYQCYYYHNNNKWEKKECVNNVAFD